LFQDYLDFGPLHREEVKQGLGHEGNQAPDDADGGFADRWIGFDVRRFGEL
jgi:hypothetical protein